MLTKRLLFLGTVPIVLMGASTALWALPARFAYVANCGDVCLGGGGGSGNVSAYTIDRTTGALTPVAGSPFLTGPGPFSVTTTAGPRPPVPQTASGSVTPPEIL